MRPYRLVAFLSGLLALTASMTLSQAQDKGDWTTIKGQVIVSKPEEAKKIEVTNDKEHCLKDGPLTYENKIVNAKSKGLKNVIVWLRPDTKDRKDTFPKDKIKPELAKVAPKNHVIDQPCCQFVPRVLAARTGDTLEVKNSASVAHNTNYSGEPAFNITIPAGKSHKVAEPLVAQSTPIPFKCDIHPWMAGRLRVFDHPYFAVTDADGKFEIKDAPAGKWRVVYWHEDGFHKGREGVIGETIEVKGPTLELKPLDFEFPK